MPKIATTTTAPAEETTAATQETVPATESQGPDPLLQVSLAHSRFAMQAAELADKLAPALARLRRLEQARDEACSEFAQMLRDRQQSAVDKPSPSV
jgi:hypothetical protein